MTEPTSCPFLDYRSVMESFSSSLGMKAFSGDQVCLPHPTPFIFSWYERNPDCPGSFVSRLTHKEVQGLKYGLDTLVYSILAMQVTMTLCNLLMWTVLDLLEQRFQVNPVILQQQLLHQQMLQEIDDIGQVHGGDVL